MEGRQQKRIAYIIKPTNDHRVWTIVIDNDEEQVRQTFNSRKWATRWMQSWSSQQNVVLESRYASERT